MNLKYYIYPVFLILLLSLSSCTEDLMTPESEGYGNDNEMIDKVYSLNFVVTLDNMGSATETRAGATLQDPIELTQWENYIDPERFRVLFFDKDDMFLFESKNRWLKQVSLSDTYSSWYVSIPFGPFGNDSYGTGKEYDWVKIRNKLTSEPFKIAILANRPSELRYPGFIDSELSLPDGVFKNDGPQWGPAETGKKSVFDLHHCQYDIIYSDKGEINKGNDYCWYDFVMGDINTSQPTMGAAINWVSFDNGDTDKVLLGGSTQMRNVKMPSKDHPIPMYGIQIFDPIPESEWVLGTPFDISNEPEEAFPNSSYNYNTISLLRSCVRVDLKIPKSIKSGKPSLVSLWYSNIYSRCEPMDTWTPTDKIWNDDHNNGCEWKNIMNYGPVSKANDTYGSGSTKNDYQKRLSWFYGVWQEKGWPFKTVKGTTVTPIAETASTPYPRIFNTCIQRNKVITCNKADVSDYYNDGYWHYVVYTGERNINDPNTLPTMTKNPYIEVFVITWDKSKYYCIPLLNYKDNDDKDLTGVFGPHSNSDMNGGNWPSALNTYIGTLPSETSNNLPYPLLRNHIYKFTLTGKTKAGGDLDGIAIDSEVVQSGDINFSQQVKKSRITAKPTFKLK